MPISYLTRHPFSQKLLNEALETVLKKATELKRAGTFIVVDVHGKLIFSYRMQEALPSTYDFAFAKAQTAVNLGISSHDVSALYSKKTEAIFFGLLTVNVGQNVPFPGGFPVRVGPKNEKVLIGGIAFGSSNLSQGKSYDTNGGVDPLDKSKIPADTLCAKVGLQVLQKGLNS